MSSFPHLSATSHNSNNGNPKKHWRVPAWFDSAIWEAATPPRSCNPVIKRKEYQLSFPTPRAKDQQQDDALQEYPPFRPFPRLPTIAIMGTPRNTGGCPPVF